VRDLNEHAGSVAGFRIATAGSAVGEIDEYLNSLADYVVAFVAADAGYKADAARVVLVGGIVQSLGGRKTVDGAVPRHFLISTKDAISRVAETVHHRAAENLGCAVRSAEIGFLLLKYLVANQKVQFRISMDEMEISERLTTLSKSGTGRNQSGWIPPRLEASHMMSAELVCCVASIDLAMIIGTWFRFFDYSNRKLEYSRS